MKRIYCMIAGVVVISLIFAFCCPINVFSAEKIRDKGAKNIEGGSPASFRTVAESDVAAPAETPVGEEADAQDEAEKPLPPGIAKMEAVPGQGLHKGWEQGKHKGWENKNPTVEPAPADTAEIAPVDTDEIAPVDTDVDQDPQS